MPLMSIKIRFMFLKCLTHSNNKYYKCEYLNYSNHIRPIKLLVLILNINVMVILCCNDW